jgi:hypothetical protein
MTVYNCKKEKKGKYYTRKTFPSEEMIPATGGAGLHLKYNANM